MPKDDFDFDDPLELSGYVLLTEEDTTDLMAECFIEEFLRLGYGPKQILALFRNPHYFAPNRAMQKRGEPFIRDLIAQVCARWGRKVEWADIATRPPTRDSSSRRESALTSSSGQMERTHVRCPDGQGEGARGERLLTDPTGAPLPQFTV